MILLTEQTRLEQIIQQLKSGALDIGDNQDSQSPKHASNCASASHQSQKLELLELERREIIGEILLLNPSYKAPADYKPLLKEAKVPIPIKAYPGYNFIGLLLGPENNMQKRLEEETGAEISVYGAKKDAREKHQITQSDLPEAQGAYEELYVNVSADTYEKVDAAIALIELLLTPVSGSSAVPSTNSASVAGDQKETASVYMMTPMPDVNRGIRQPVLVTAQPALPQYPPYPAPWDPVASFNAPRPPFGSMPPLPNNSICVAQSPAGPHSVGPLLRQNPPFSSTLGSLSAGASRPQLPMQAMPQPLNQATPPRSLPMPAQRPPPAYTVTQSQLSSTAPPFTASQSMPSGTMPAPRPPVPVNPWPASIAPAGQLPNRPLISPAVPGSSGWPTTPSFVPPGQRPPQFAPPSMTRPMRPQPAVSATPIASASSALNMSSDVATWPSAVASVPSLPNMPTNVINGRPPANFAPPAVFPSRPSSGPLFSTMPPPSGPVSTPVIIPSTSGAPLHASISASAPRPPPIPSPAPGPSPMPVPASSPILGPRPFVPQTAALVSTSSPILAQASAPSPSVPPVMVRPPIPLQSAANGQAPRPAQPPMPSPQPPSATPVSNSWSMPSFTPVTPASSTVNATPIVAPRPPRPVPGDFTFQPVRAQVPASPTTPGPSSQSVHQTSIRLAPPQAPSFRPAMQNPTPPLSSQGFPAYLAANQTGPSQAPIPPTPSSVAPFSVNPAVIQPAARRPVFPSTNPGPPLAPATQMGPPSFSIAPAASSLPDNMSAHLMNFMQPHQNPLPPVNRPSGIMIGGNSPGFMAGKISSSPGGSQIYDPFSPTSISSASTMQGGDPVKIRKPESDAEYEDLMASVGVSDSSCNFVGFKQGF
ncbi:uncharacterized protein [Elaeis guineensis]|uniref:Basic proline-rich protein isoform X2 n=1 Tax=Elaeis guineensis var. tenera TaxID=51953 RepID=A0A6I9S1I2_ELAGV|nr:basic proline-rich protein isoform X2 [Elaeis guineensis]